MTRSGLLSLLCCALALSACAADRHRDAGPAAPARPMAPAVAADGTPLSYADGVPVEKIPFRTGVSSATVEQLAKAQSCHGGLGAGLVSEPGPVEIYRMACDDGKTFIARCDLRQCQPISLH